jgi:tetratricopeptide (TPR) repeat protein
MSHLPRHFVNSPQMLAGAAELYRCGRLREAEAATRQVLAFQPSNSDALNLLGSIALSLGQFEAAAGILASAAQLAPNAVEVRINLGHAMKSLGKLAEAIASYRIAVDLQPARGEARYALGSGLMMAGELDAAASELRKATRLLPRFAAAFNNLGHVSRQQGQPKEAEEAFRRAIRLEPNRVETYLNLALAVGEQNRTEDTIVVLRDALRIAPDNPDALHALGTLLVKTRRFEEAIPPLRRLRALQPGTADPFAGLAQALTVQGEFEEAMMLAREAVRIHPNDAGSRSNYAGTLAALGRLGEAEAEYDAALAQSGDFGPIRLGRAFVLMRAGRLEEAWDDYEARLEADLMGVTREAIALVDPAHLKGRPWDGSLRAGRSLLVYPEQGLGDAIQMARYATLLAADGPVHWMVPPALRRLMELSSATGLVSTGEEVPEHDLHCSVMSLPRMFRTTLATIPATMPYLRVDPSRTEAWRTRLDAPPGRRIGLAWKGNPHYLFDRLRSVPGEQLGILGGLPTITFVSLQLPRQDVPPALGLVDWTDELADLSETAALIEALDLVISVDTSIAHLAGALGRPVWLLNRFNSDWRWLHGRTDSPWYPTMRIFTQTAPNDWCGVLAAVRAALSR